MARTFSAEADEILAQLLDIAHEGDIDSERPGIAWYLVDETPPQAAIDELVAAGLVSVETTEIELSVLLDTAAYRREFGRL